ncbi:MAG TPA: GNAT family N-acetyltransferase, partial [Sphingomonadaceae bacterium]|nr:GNAT family N-acetyltransferase [Sphingomonadaceae bacterium]
AGWEIRRLGPGDEMLVEQGGHLFDDPPIPHETTRFLVGEDNFLWFALVEGKPAGFVSAVLLRHPDKRPSLFVNELGVDDEYRRRGIATALMEAAVAQARALGCEAAWVAAESDDELAIAFYESMPNQTTRMARVFEWAGD